MIHLNELNIIKKYTYKKVHFFQLMDKYEQIYFYIEGQKNVLFATFTDCKKVISGLLPDYDVYQCKE